MKTPGTKVTIIKTVAEPAFYVRACRGHGEEPEIWKFRDEEHFRTEVSDLSEDEVEMFLEGHSVLSGNHDLEAMDYECEDIYEEDIYQDFTK